MKRVYYIQDCCGGKACYMFETFDQAYEGCKSATTGDQNKIKSEIQIAEIDKCNGFMIGQK